MPSGVPTDPNVPQYDLVAAVIACLESNQSVVSLFQDSWNQQAQTGVAKFFTDMVDQVTLPYCLITEVGETYQYMTEGGPGKIISFMSPGQMTFDIFAQARAMTRQLGFAVAQALNDYPLSWPTSNSPVMEFRMIRSQFIPVSDPSGPYVPVIFRRQFVFEYMYSASLQIFS